MAENHLQETDIHSEIGSDSSTTIGASTLVFQKSLITDSPKEHATLAKQFENVSSLGDSDPLATFTMHDIVGSSNSGAGSITSVSQLGDGTDGLAGLTLLGGSGGEFMIVSSESDLDGNGVIQQNGTTITLRLDDATRYLLQQQQHGIAQAVELSDGTFQLLKQPIVQVEREDGTLQAQTLHIEVLQALQGELHHQLSLIAPNYSMGEDMGGLDDIPSSSEIKNETASNVGADDSQNESSVDHGDSLEEPPLKEMKDFQKENDFVVSESENSEDKTQQVEEGRTVAVKKECEYKQPDLNCPIPLSEQTVVTIKGKKCVLAFNQETKQVCAYPIKPPPGTKRRGRPRMTEEEKAAAAEKKRQHLSQFATDPASQAPPSEKSTAAETLLELSNVDGVRRSARKRKKARILEEYEEMDDSEEDHNLGFEDNKEKDPDISLALSEVKKRKVLPLKKEMVPSSPAVYATNTEQPVKRGRGRPRRYPPPGQLQTSIPALMIPQANGQTLVMTQGLQNLQSFHRQLPNIIPKPSIDSGTLTISVTASDRTDHNTLSLCSDTDTLPLDASAVLDSHSIIPAALQGDTIPIVGDNPDSSDHGDTLDHSSSLLSFMMQTASASDKSKDVASAEETDSPMQPTVIQIPDNVLASLGFKKDPVKIGLKASDRELEKMKCPKCDFQGYYVQQYRNHIATHGDDIQKCKCCSYLSLDGDELLEHFKEYHPRCFCSECGYMAEHAYIIKRHMMRHDTKSCTCNMCGKVYKDMYILKMHIKMVHMPAEVLFECNVCSKKFTRKAHLKRHLRIHEPEKPYKCPVCDYRGCEKSDISKHMLIHEEPKHTCERCGKTFRHIKNKELHVKRHYGQRDYKCGVCDFFGYTFTDIRKHIERKHQDIKTLICDKCNKHLKNEVAMKEHQQTCNVMMIEQGLAILTSSGGTSQATIQIPTNLGPDGQIILDGQAITMEGQTISVSRHGGVSIMVDGEPQLSLAEGTTEEEEEDLEDEDGGINQTMQINYDQAIMTESGEQMHIISSEILGDSGQVVSHVFQQGVHQGQVIVHDGQVVGSSPDMNILTDSGQILEHIGHIVDGKKQIPLVSASKHFIQQSDVSSPSLDPGKEESRGHTELTMQDSTDVLNAGQHLHVETHSSEMSNS
ncbi:hypothetical protein BsWGS_28110 [Bradybaena similaris]